MQRHRDLSSVYRRSRTDELFVLKFNRPRGHWYPGTLRVIGGEHACL